MRFAWIAAGLAFGFGCDKVLGLTSVPPPPDAPIPNQYTFDYTLRAITNTPTGIATTDALYDPSALVVRSPDGALVPFTRTGTGSYEFEMLSDDYELQFVPAVAAFPARVQHDARELHYLQTLLDRADKVLASDDVTLDFSTIPVGSGSFDWRAYSTGVWGSIDLINLLGGRKATANWRDTNTGLVDATRNDRFYYLEYAYDFTIGMGVATHYIEFDTLQMHQGSAFNSLGNPPMQSPVLRDARVQADAPSEYDRVASTLLPNADAIRLYIEIVASPGGVIDAFSGPVLAYATTGMKPQPIDGGVKFYNMIAGTNAVAIATLSSKRSVKLPKSVLGYPFVTLLGLVAPPYSATGSAGETGTIPTATVGVISSVQIAGVELSADNVVVVPDGNPTTTVTWTVASGAFDQYVVRLFEMTDINGFTYPIYVDTIETVASQVVLQSSVLQPGHYYALTIVGVLGRPSARNGDFRTESQTGGFEQYIPGMFTVALPQPGP